MLDYGVTLGGLNIKTGSLYGSGSNKTKSLQFKLQNSSLIIGNKKVSGTGSALSDKETAGTLARNFKASLLANLVISNNLSVSKDKHTDEENEALAESVTSLVTEVKEEFGDSEANRLMAKILLNTEGGVTENRVTAAIGEFFKSIKDEAMATLGSTGASEESYAKADATLGKLERMVSFLNYGDSEKTTEDGEESNSLSKALNAYFGKERTSDADKKIFSSNFEFLTLKEIEALKGVSEEEKEEEDTVEFILTKAELGDSAINGAISYLSETLSSEEAANILINLEEDGDVLAAVEEARSYLASLDKEEEEEEKKEESSIASGKASEAATSVAASATKSDEAEAAKIVTEVVKASGKKALFDEFLNSSFVKEINKAVQESESVGGRLKSLVSSKIGYEVGVSSLSVVGWPGTGGVISASGVSVSIGYEREFTISVSEDNKIEASSKETIKISASFVSGVFLGSQSGFGLRFGSGIGLGTGLGLGFGTSFGTTFGTTFAANGYELSRTLEQRYAEGRISVNKSSSVTASRAGLISAKV
jgi:hypothetical protein